MSSDGNTQQPYERYVYLKDDKAIVYGAKFSLIVDFDTGGLHRINASASELFRLTQKGISIEEAMEVGHSDPESTNNLIRSMQEKNLIHISGSPRNTETDVAAVLQPKLSFVWIEVISQCNLRCIHCYAKSTDSPNEVTERQSILSWLDQAADMGCRKVQFTGGECTLREDLRDIISHAIKRKFETIEIFTNGVSLDRALIAFLADNNIQVALSLYSYSAGSHDRITGVAGSHSKTIDSLKYLLAYGVPVRGSIIALKQNEKELEATQTFLEGLGVSCGPADPIRPCGRGLDMENWPRDYGLSFMRTRPDFCVDKELYVKSQHWNNCWFGKAAITSEGEVMPCVFARDQVAGNLNENSLQFIVENSLSQYWKLTRDKISVCRDCEYRYICKDCRPWAYGYSGDLHAKSPTCTYDPYTGEWGEAELALRNSKQGSNATAVQNSNL